MDQFDNVYHAPDDFFSKAAGVSEIYLKNNVVPKLLEERNAMNDHCAKVGLFTVTLPVESKASEIHGKGVFATRDLKKGEVFQLTMIDLTNSKMINDGAYFPACDFARSLSEMRSYYEEQVEVYRLQSAEKANVRYFHETNPETDDKVGTLRVLKDIQQGEELLESYGIPYWILHTPERFNTNVVYRDWFDENFKLLFNDSPRRHQYSVMVSFVDQLGLGDDMLGAIAQYRDKLEQIPGWQDKLMEHLRTKEEAKTNKTEGPTAPGGEEGTAEREEEEVEEVMVEPEVD